MISKLRPSSANSRPPIFSADCELDHIHPRITAARCGSPDGASRFQCPGWQGRLALYCAGGLVFLRTVHWRRCCPPGPRGEDAGRLSESIAVATRFGHLLDFPEHPDKGNAEADDDAQKQQCQAGGCEHGDLHIILQRRTSDWRQKAASVQNTPRPREFSRLSRSSTLINRTGPSVSRRRRRDQPQTWTGRTCYPVRECTRRRTVLAAPPALLPPPLPP
jgi:hypothetical protein